MQQAAFDFNNLNINAPGGAKLTPMMQQYFEIKSHYSDCLLFYRLGDFYELFFDDAIIASATLDIVLTKRGKGTELEIPMCGVPAHSHEFYLKKLIEAGFKVAVCNQLETPEEAKKRGAKSVVRREVTRIITPGTIIEDNLLNAKENSYLCAVAGFEGKVAVSWLDITTGDFYVAQSVETLVFADLQRLRPAEIIIAERYANALGIYSALPEFKRIITPRPNGTFDLKRAEQTIASHYKISSARAVLKDFSDVQMVAVGAMLEYVAHTQKSAAPLVKTPKILKSSDYMWIDPATIRNLEIYSSVSNSKKDSLLGVMDKTHTAGGGRLLNFYLSCPLLDATLIDDRLDVVQFMITNWPTLSELQHQLSAFPDLERSLAKTFLGKATPRDLASIRTGLHLATYILETFKFKLADRPRLLEQNLNLMADLGGLLQQLQEALTEEMPGNLEDGGFVRSGFSEHLDELYRFKNNADQELSELRDRYRLKLAIPTLKITSNNVLGYFIEVTPANKNKIDEQLFRLRQTTGSSYRYTSDELVELESKLVSVDSRIRNLEHEIFTALCQAVIAAAEKVACAAQSMAFIDVMLGLAQLALENNYVRPTITKGREFNITQGRHPVVERLLRDKFIANDSNFTQSETIKLITGPNMAGKSTYMRQNALITIMAQIGSFVPASSATIGVVDKLFSRIGAGDDISRGQSTFMVEMLETANIINNATPQSLIILDEIGRGTATYDGLSIAWAVLEDIHNRIGARTLFATHYHELTALENQLAGIACYNLAVADEGERVIFLHLIQRGRANRSYGIHVAQLAGMPLDVVNRAESILEQLTGEQPQINIEPRSANEIRESSSEQKLTSLITKLDIDSLTPRDAFNFLYELKKQI